MPSIPSKKPYRIGRSATGLGLFATKRIKKGTKIIRYFGPLLDCKKKKDDAIENKYLFELNNRWTIDGSVRENVARYINHACKPNAESDVRPRKRKVFIRAIKNIEPGDEINYDYGTDYFKAYLKPIGCKCVACEKKRKKKRAEARAERLRLKAKAERKAQREAEKKAAKRAKDKLRARNQAKKQLESKAREKLKAKSKTELKPDRKRKVVSQRKAPTVRLKTGSSGTKRKVAAGARRNSGIVSRRGRPKPVVEVTTMAVAAEPMTAASETPVSFATPSVAIPASNEAQQVSA